MSVSDFRAGALRGTAQSVMRRYLGWRGIRVPDSTPILTFALRGHFPGFRSVSHVPATPMFRKPLGEDLPPFHTLGFLPCCCFHMFLRSTNRKKDGKNHRYFSVVENRRLPGDKTVQRTVLYLGEINDQ